MSGKWSTKDPYGGPHDDDWVGPRGNKAAHTFDIFVALAIGLAAGFVITLTCVSNYPQTFCPVLSNDLRPAESSAFVAP